MANHYNATDSRSVGGSAATTAALGDTVQDCSSAGLAGAHRAGDGRRQERPGGSRRTGHHPWYRRQVAAAFFCATAAMVWWTSRDRERRARLGTTTWSGWWCKPWRRSRQVLRIGSTRSMAKACGLSAATVSRIWRAFGLKPHRCETFKLSRDPLFIEKVRDIVGLYLHPPERAVVLCVDEKPQIQALERSQPVLPMRPGLAGAAHPRLPPPRNHVVVCGPGRSHR